MVGDMNPAEAKTTLQMIIERMRGDIRRGAYQSNPPGGTRAMWEIEALEVAVECLSQTQEGVCDNCHAKVYRLTQCGICEKSLCYDCAESVEHFEYHSFRAS